MVAGAFALADILIEQGRLQEAITTYHQALQLAAEHGPEAQQITAHHYLGLAMLYHEMGKDDLKDENLEKAGEYGEQTTLVDWPYRWRVAQARLQQSCGDMEFALTLLDEAQLRYVKTLIPDIRPIEALKANIYLKQGRLDKAEDWARLRGLSMGDEVNYLNEFEHLILARVLIAGHQSRRSYDSLLQAIGLLERLLKAAEAQGRIGSVLEILVAQAFARQEQGNPPLALASLQRALTLAEPEGYVRLFVDEGQPMRLMMADCRQQMVKQKHDQTQKLTAYCDRLLAALSHQGVEPLSKIKNQLSIMIEPLSERELEVLKLLRTELSGPEIAGHLVISLNTFRTHTKNIFSKLGVNNRRTAVRRAEELALF